MTYYHASTVGSNLKRLVVHPTLVENHIVVYATPERAVESDAIKYWDNYVGQLVVHNGNVYMVDSLVGRLPYSIRKCYSSNRECVLSNLNILFD